MLEHNEGQIDVNSNLVSIMHAIGSKFITYITQLSRYLVNLGKKVICQIYHRKINKWIVHTNGRSQRSYHFGYYRFLLSGAWIYSIII